MEANSTISLIGVFHWLFPSLIGSALAVWYKRNDIDWSNKTGSEKLMLSLLGVAAIIVGVVIGLTIAKVVITYTGVSEYWYQFGIHLVSSLSSLKVLDIFVKNMDEIFAMVVDAIKSALRKLINKLTGGGH